MTRKHFIDLAEVLRKLKPTKAEQSGPYDEGWDHGCVAQWNAMTQALADFCQTQNPRFDRERWLGYIAGENSANGKKLKGEKPCSN